ncbi:MAG: hypothetical protein AAB355_01290 [Patescibacteria group bacterium]
MVSLFESTTQALQPRRTTEFQVKHKDKPSTIHLKVAVSLIQREDGSGESWNFEGYALPSGKRLKGYYSTRTRKGTVKFHDNGPLV